MLTTASAVLVAIVAAGFAVAAIMDRQRRVSAIVISIVMTLSAACLTISDLHHVGIVPVAAYAATFIGGLAWLRLAGAPAAPPAHTDANDE